MIARYHRFHGYGSLKGVYSRGQTLRAPQLSLKFLRRDPKQPYRMAVVVSKKVHKSAVVRNRIRRRVYECIRRREADIPSGIDLVFTIFTDELATMAAPQLETLVGGLANKAILEVSREPNPRSGTRGIVNATRE